MPRLKRRAKTLRERGYGDGHIRELLKGSPFFPGTGFCGDEEAKREAWEELGEELTADWVTKRPGTRPCAWWLYDAPEPRRRCTNRDRHPFDEPTYIERAKRTMEQYPDALDLFALWFGRPRCETGETAFCDYESHADFLDRHGLIDFTEQQAIDVTGAEPWPW